MASVNTGIKQNGSTPDDSQVGLYCYNYWSLPLKQTLINNNITANMLNIYNIYIQQIN